MHIPEKRQCDLCRADLVGAFVVMSYPLDQADRQQVGEAMKADMPGPFAILSGMFDVAPKMWRFDFCRGCADGFMPMLADLKTHAVKAWLAERERRTAAPIGDTDV